MDEVLVNRLGGLSLPRKSVVRLTDRPDMTLDVYRGRKTIQQQQQLPVPLTCLKHKLPLPTMVNDGYCIFSCLQTEYLIRFIQILASLNQ